MSGVSKQHSSAYLHVQDNGRLRWTRVPVSLIIYGHVAGFITLDALDEVLHGLLNIAICIIRTPKLNLLERNARLSR